MNNYDSYFKEVTKLIGINFKKGHLNNQDIVDNFLKQIKCIKTGSTAFIGNGADIDYIVHPKYFCDFIKEFDEILFDEFADGYEDEFNEVVVFKIKTDKYKYDIIIPYYYEYYEAMISATNAMISISQIKPFDKFIESKEVRVNLFRTLLKAQGLKLEDNDYDYIY